MLKLYTQNNCQYCDILKDNLKTWGLSFETINISTNTNGKTFLKTNGHKTVPQLYLKDFNINDGVETLGFTEADFYDRLDTFIESHSQDDIKDVIAEYDKAKLNENQ